MRTPQRIALIGYGAVSQAVLRHFADHQMEVLCVLLRPGWREKQRAGLPVPLRFLDDVGEMLSLKPDLVIECAGQGAVAQYAERVVGAGADLRARCQVDEARFLGGERRGQAGRERGEAGAGERDAARGFHGSGKCSSDDATDVAKDAAGGTVVTTTEATADG